MDEKERKKKRSWSEYEGERCVWQKKKEKKYWKRWGNVKFKKHESEYNFIFYKTEKRKREEKEKEKTCSRINVNMRKI